ncbi:MAG: hypothetical protein WBX49_02335 [Candidatus Deferrimicrobiaceae bacterium]
MDAKPLKKFMPEDAAAKVPPDNPACLVNGRDVFRALASHNVIVMACNIRIPQAFRAEGTARIVADYLSARV